MTKIQLELDETDLHKAVRSIIDHNNADEITKFLVHCIGASHDTANIFFKTYLGAPAPRVLLPGEMIKVLPKSITWKTQEEEMRKHDLIDKSGYCTAVIKEFRGFHDSSTYYVSFANVNDEDEVFQDTGWLSYKDVIEVIEEF